MTKPSTQRVGDNLEALASVANAEVEREWQRRVSLEARAFAIFTLNLAAATLYLVMQQGFSLAQPTPGSVIHTVLMVSLGAVVGSTVLAIVVAIPWGHTSLNGAVIQMLADKIDTLDEDYRWNIAKAQSIIIQATYKVNLAKAIVLIVAFCIVGIETIGLTIVLTNLEAVPRSP